MALELTARNEDAQALYAHAGLTVLPLGLVGAGEVSLRFNGVPEEGGPTRLAFTGDGLELVKRWMRRCAMKGAVFDAENKWSIIASVWW